MAKIIAPSYPLASTKHGTHGVARGLEPGRGHAGDIVEADLLEQCRQLPHGERAADSVGPGVQAAGDLRRQGAVEYQVGELQPAARLQHPVYLVEGRVLVGREIQGTVGDDQVEAGIEKRQVFRRGLLNVSMQRSG